MSLEVFLTLLFAAFVGGEFARSVRAMRKTSRELVNAQTRLLCSLHRMLLRTMQHASACEAALAANGIPIPTPPADDSADAATVEAHVLSQ